MADLGKEIVFPADENAERAVIASVLINNTTLEAVSDLIQPEDFYINAYGDMFRAMQILKYDGMAIDTVTLERRLRDLDLYPDGYNAIMKRLLSERMSSVHAETYARIVQDKARLRRLMNIAEQTKEKCKTGKSADEVMESLEQNVYKLSRMSAGTAMVDMHVEGSAYLQNFTERKSCKGGIVGIPTGLHELDNMLHGLQTQKTYVIGARPSMGKSALALTIASYVTFHEHKPALIFSIEMGRNELYDRLISMRTHIPLEQIVTGNVTAEQEQAIIDCVDEIERSELQLECHQSEITDIRRLARLHKMKNDVRVIIIDYFQLMSGGGNGNRPENRQQELSNVSRELKILAEELDVPIIVLAQLNRSVEKREDKRPIMSDLKDCGALEQDADVIIFLYRDEYYHKRDDNKFRGVAELLIRKQRGGRTGDVIVSWQPQRATFLNVPV